MRRTDLHDTVNGKNVCRNCVNRKGTYCGIQAKHVPRKGTCWKFEKREAK